MHTVSINGQAKQVAATWDELSQQQLVSLMPILFGQYADPIRQRLDALAVLLDISPALLLRFTPVQLVEIKWLAGFLLGEQIDLTRQLMPWVRTRWFRRRLFGPAAGLRNISFLEFVFADSFFIAYCQSQDVAWLHKLLAVLYRPGRLWGGAAAGDRRVPFNENLLARNVARVARLPQYVQLAIFTWYRGCRHAWEQRYPLVFTPDHEGQARGNTDGWSYVLREVSGGPFGNYDSTGRQHAAQLLAKMQDDLARAEELKSKQSAS